MVFVKHRPLRGVTLAELLVAIAILAILSVITLTSFRSFNAGEALDTDAFRILGELQEARSLTMASKNASQYGLHVATSSVTLFEGAAYPGTTISTTALTPLIQITAIALQGGGNDVIFERLTGKAAQYGTLIIAATTDPSRSRTITVYQTGLSEIH